jgi:hypothetical protein
MPVLFADTYASFLTSNKLNSYLFNNKLSDLNKIFEFDKASQGAKIS